MSNNKITIGDKEYTREELLEFGKQHYPKFYWITRGAGIGLMLIGVVSALVYVSIFLTFGSTDRGTPVLSMFYLITIPFAFMALIGVVLFGISFRKRPDEDYIKHAVDYYTKLNANRVARESKIKAREEKVARKEEQKDISQLIKYKELLDAGIITQEEFDKKKQEYLDN